MCAAAEQSVAVEPGTLENMGQIASCRSGVDVTLPENALVTGGASPPRMRRYRVTGPGVDEVRARVVEAATALGYVLIVDLTPRNPARQATRAQGRSVSRHNGRMGDLRPGCECSVQPAHALFGVGPFAPRDASVGDTSSSEAGNPNTLVKVYATQEADRIVLKLVLMDDEPADDRAS